MSKLNKIEGYCLEVLKKSEMFFNDPKNDDTRSNIHVNTHHERSEMAKDILKIIEENNNNVKRAIESDCHRSELAKDILKIITEE